MDDKVKIIMEIPKDVYAECQEHKYFPDTGEELFNAVKNATSLDSVKAEIKEKCDNINHITSHLPYSTHRFVQEVLCLILEIIDNAESEAKTNEKAS